MEELNKYVERRFNKMEGAINQLLEYQIQKTKKGISEEKPQKTISTSKR